MNKLDEPSRLAGFLEGVMFARGMTAATIAAAAEIPERSVKRYLRDPMSMGIKALARIGFALGVEFTPHVGRRRKVANSQSPMGRIDP